MIENEEQAAELPLDTAGAQLMRARQAAGQSLADLARITKISERQLGAIETGNYAALPSRAYAIGFTRTYAKAVRLDSNAIIAMVRGRTGAGAADRLPGLAQSLCSGRQPPFDPAQRNAYSRRGGTRARTGAR